MRWYTSYMAHRIYLVDDDRFLVSLYAAKFTEAGYAPTAFASAEEVLAQLRKDAAGTAPDVILLDLIMPGTDGFTALETIRKEALAQGSKIIILSNEGQDAEIDRAKQLKADGYIIKASAIPSEVLAEVSRIVGPASLAGAPATQGTTPVSTTP